MKSSSHEKNKFSGMIAMFSLLYVAILVEVFVKIFAYFNAGFSLENISLFVAYGASLPCILLSFSIYLGSSRSSTYLSQTKLMAVILALFLNFTVNLIIEEFDLYLIPTAFAALILVQLVDKRDVFVSNLILNMVMLVTTFFESKICGVEYAAMESIFMFLISVLTGAVISYSLSGVSSRISFILRSFLIVSINIELMYMINLVSDVFYFFELVGWLCLANYGQVVLSMVFEPIFESVFRILTNTKLQELTDHNAPLVHRLISEAPGTFNHCLSVASLAEVCAMAIGENALLTKACAYYHDMGKLSSPMYFAENQSVGENPHDNLLPEVSADILRRHTTYGYELCRQNKIPEEIARVTVEHHGTLPMAVFYNKAKQLTDSDVDIEDYSYYGSHPTTKIAAIIMICDACEAALRSMGNPTSEQVEQLLGNIIRDRIERGQFDDCSITMQDINNIRETIKNAYGGLVHSRVKYPKGDK